MRGPARGTAAVHGRAGAMVTSCHGRGVQAAPRIESDLPCEAAAFIAKTVIGRAFGGQRWLYGFEDQPLFPQPTTVGMTVDSSDTMYGAHKDLARARTADAVTRVRELRSLPAHERAPRFAAWTREQYARHPILPQRKHPIVYDIVEGLWVRCGPILSHLYDAGLPDWEPHPHLRVIAALRDGDGEAARDAIREDIERGGHGLLVHVKDSQPAT